MSSFETRPPVALDRAAPVGRGLWCWPALLAGLAPALDAVWPLPFARGTFAPLWIDVAAVVCLAWALSGRGRRTGWKTPLDGRIVSGLALALLHAVWLAWSAGPVTWLHHVVAAGACYYALAARLRRESRAPDAVWPACALGLLALSAVVLGHATGGARALQAACREVDARWASQFGLAKALGLATLLCAGRASEPGARALWRVTAVTGLVTSALCVAVDGVGLSVASLASLDEPFYFGTSIVAFMLLAALSRMAWQLARERPGEAGRWRAAALVFPSIAALLVFGGTTGGEGVRVLLGLAGAAVVATRLAPGPAAARRGAARASDPPMARAA